MLDNVMDAYISHGPDGHGAFPAQGSTVAGRINAGIDRRRRADQRRGEFQLHLLDGNFTNVKVQKDRTSTFGDIVYYADYQKNPCCVGGLTSCTAGGPGIRIDGTIASQAIGLNGTMPGMITAISMATASPTW